MIDWKMTVDEEFRDEERENIITAASQHSSKIIVMQC